MKLIMKMEILHTELVTEVYTFHSQQEISKSNLKPWVKSILILSMDFIWAIEFRLHFQREFQYLACRFCVYSGFRYLAGPGVIFHIVDINVHIN